MAAALNETVVCCVQAALPLAVYVSCVEPSLSLCRMSCVRALLCLLYCVTDKRSYIYIARGAREVEDPPDRSRGRPRTPGDAESGESTLSREESSVRAPSLSD